MRASTADSRALHAKLVQLNLPYAICDAAASHHIHKYLGAHSLAAQGALREWLMVLDVRNALIVSYYSAFLYICIKQKTNESFNVKCLNNQT